MVLTPSMQQSSRKERFNFSAPDFLPLEKAWGLNQACALLPVAFPCLMTQPDRGALDGLKIDRSSQPRGRSFPWGLLGGLLLIGGGILWWWMQPGAPLVKLATVRAQTVKAAGESQTLLNASGYVTARRAATVSAKVTGKVTEILVE